MNTVKTPKYCNTQNIAVVTVKITNEPYCRKKMPLKDAEKIANSADFVQTDSIGAV